MGTCKTCKFWNANFETSKRWFDCKLTLTYYGVPLELDTLAVVESYPISYGALKMNEDFGCNQHQPATDGD